MGDTLWAVGALDGHLNDAVASTRARVAESVAFMDDWKLDRTPRMQRLADLEILISDLQAARAPLTEHVRTLPQIGRASNPIVQLDRQATRTLRRLRSMRRPTSGTPRPPAPVGTLATLNGTFARVKQVLDAVDKEHKAIRNSLAMGSWRATKGGGGFLSMAELNDEATKLLPRIDAERARLNLAWSRYDRTHAERVAAASKPHRVKDKDAELRDHVELLRDAIKSLRADVKASATQAEPTVHERRSYERWTPDDVQAAWMDFYNRHERWPVKADHTPVNKLPHPTQLRRAVGPKPIATMLALVTTNSDEDA